MAIFRKKTVVPSSKGITLYNPSTQTATTYTSSGSTSQSISRGSMAFGSSGANANIPIITPSRGGGGGSSSSSSSSSSLSPKIISELKTVLNKQATTPIRTSLSQNSINALARKLNVSSSTIRNAKIQQRNNNTSIIKTTSGNYVIKKENLNPNTGRPYGMISAVERKKGLAGIQQRTSERLDAYATERSRTTSKNTKKLGQAYKRELGIVGTTALGVGVSTIRGVIQLPRNLVNIVKNPKNIVTGIKSIPKAITTGGAEFGRILKVSPTEAITKVGANYLLLKGTKTFIKGGGTFKIKGTIKPSIANKISSKFKRAEKVYIVGKQTTNGKAIITNIYFKSGRNKFGSAKGVSVQKGSNALTTSVGVGGKRKLGGGLKNPIVFAGIERTRLNKVTPYIPLKNGLRIPVFNLNHVIQRGKGIVASTTLKNVRGKKVFRSSKDTFNSLSRVFTQKDLSVIIGSTISGKGNKAKFIGLIKNIKNKGSIGKVTLSKVTKQQYQQALNKVVSVASASIATAKKLNKGKALSNAKTITKAREILSSTISPLTLLKSKNNNLKQIVTTRPTIKNTPNVTITPTTKTNTNTVVTVDVITRTVVTPKHRGGVRSRTTTITKQIPITTTITKITPKLKIGQKLSKAQISRLRYKLIPQTVGRRIVGVRVAGIKFKVPSKSNIKIKPIIKKTKASNLFIPYAKQGNKYIRLSKLPLKRNDALSRASYVADNTVSATIKLKPIGRAKRVGSLKAFEKGYFNKKHQKFRGFKIKKGNRYMLTNKAIEKRKFRIDTRGEKKDLSVAKFLKRKRLR